MTDFHTHVLPKMDDGSSGTEESLDMLRAAAAQGIAAVVATPHYYAKREAPEKFLERRQASYRRLREVIESQGAAELLPELYLGAEVKMFSGIGSLELLSEAYALKKGKQMRAELDRGALFSCQADVVKRICNTGPNLITIPDKWLLDLDTERDDRSDELLLSPNATFLSQQSGM